VSLRGQSGLLGKPVSALAPDVVSAILRDDDESPTALYPTLLGVFCDADGTVIEADIIVNDRVSKPERLEMIRQYARSQGWVCSAHGDWCPACTGKAVL
jgi:hypothetical protein